MVVKSGTSSWIPLKAATHSLSDAALTESGETEHGEWGKHGGAGLCMVKPDDKGRLSILILKNAPGTHDADLWSIPGGALQTTLDGQPEDGLHCALRETHEEVGRLPEAKVWTNPIVLRKAKTGFTYRYYMCMLESHSMWRPQLYSGEHCAHHWQAMEYALNEPNLHPGLAVAIQQMPSQWVNAFKSIHLNLNNSSQPTIQSDFITAAQYAIQTLEIPLSESIQSRPNQILDYSLNHLIEQAGSPTNIWLNRHPDATPPGWTQSQIKELPANISDLIKIENNHAKTHAVAYHGFEESQLAGHWTGEVLMKNLCKHESETVRKTLNHLSWHRNPFKPNKDRYRDVANLTNFVSTSPSRDNGDVGRFALLSCNPSLFQNCDQDAMESTADYLYDAINVAPPDVKQWIVDMLKSQNPATDKQRVDQAATAIMNLCGDASARASSTTKASVLMQILIPHHLVNDVAYISKKNGIPDTDNTNALETLLRLKSPETASNINNAQSLQIRVLSSALQSPKLAQQIKVNLFGRYTASQQEVIKSGIQSIIEQLEQATA